MKNRVLLSIALALIVFASFGCQKQRVRPVPPDYDRPLAYVGLCYVCHMMLHCRFRAPESWQRYCEAIAGGVRFGPVRSRDFSFIKALLSGKDVRKAQGEPPARDVFKEIGVKK